MYRGTKKIEKRWNMVNVDELKGKMTARNITHAEMAERLDITPKTFGSRLKKRIFLSTEIEIMIEVLCLSIEDIMFIFFDKEVTH